MWAELADKDFSGGTLQDLDPDLAAAPETEIVSVELADNFFTVNGKDYTCSIRRDLAGLGAQDGWFVVSSQFGKFRFKGKS